MYIHAGTLGCQKRVSEPLELKLQTAVSCLMRVLGSEFGPLQEQQAHLITEPCLQPLSEHLVSTTLIIFMTLGLFIYIFIFYINFDISLHL